MDKNELKSKEVLLTYLHDMEDFAILKNIQCPPIYLLGGSACILADYLTRATTDFDLIDTGYPAHTGRLLKILERFDLLDYFVTPLPPDYMIRARKLTELQLLDIYVLAPEDIIVSKLSRYSEKDVHDISELIKFCNKELIIQLILDVSARIDFSERVKEMFIKNAEKFKRCFYV